MIYRGEVSCSKTAQAAWASAFEKAEQNDKWVCGSLRKFSQFASELAVLITKYPYENEFSTDISLFVLRKSNLWFDFLKFTFAVRSHLGSYMATHRSSKSKIFELPANSEKIVMFRERNDLRDLNL